MKNLLNVLFFSLLFFGPSSTTFAVTKIISIKQNSLQMFGDSIVLSGVNAENKEVIQIYNHELKEVWSCVVKDRANFIGGNLFEFKRLPNSVVFVFAKIYANYDYTMSENNNKKLMVRVLEYPLSGGKEAILDELLTEGNEKDITRASDLDKKYGIMSLTLKAWYEQRGQNLDSDPGTSNQEYPELESFLKINKGYVFLSHILKKKQLVVQLTDELFKDGELKSENGIRYFFGDTSNTFKANKSGYVYVSQDELRQFNGNVVSKNGSKIAFLSMQQKRKVNEEDTKYIHKNGVKECLIDEVFVDVLDMEEEQIKSQKINVSEMVKLIPFSFKNPERIHLIPLIANVNDDGKVDLLLRVMDVTKVILPQEKHLKYGMDLSYNFNEYGWVYVTISPIEGIRYRSHKFFPGNGFLERIGYMSFVGERSISSYEKIGFPILFNFLDYPIMDYHKLLGYSLKGDSFFPPIYNRELKNSFFTPVLAANNAIYYMDIPDRIQKTRTLRALKEGKDLEVLDLSTDLNTITMYFYYSGRHIFCAWIADSEVQLYCFE